ncbi:MAG: Xaa-Pro peptidase family protein [Actinomycetota bacterium]|nr:Xaa-Pro peptidase family protein [Actinomycetota bacterium]MDP9438640.1 Xaa-Pro peptidase family protein [Actinomycetota bacterium]
MNEQIISSIRRRLRERGLDAYVAYTPSNVFYATGFQSYFLMQWWRMQGTVLAVIPADESVEVGMMIGDFEANPARRVSGIRDVRAYRLWPEIRDAEAVGEPLGSGETEAPRPAQFDEGEQDGIVRGLLGDRGLLGARIGSDLRYMLFDSYRRFSAVAPQAQWVDFTDEMYALRRVKYPSEVERLRRATELSEAGMRFAVEDLRPGMTATEVRHRYVMGVAQAAMGDARYQDYSDDWILPAVGAGVGIGVDSERDAGLQEGDLIKFDCGTTVGGYRGDGGRTFVYGRVKPAAERLFGVLQEAHDRACEAIRPGVEVGEIFRIAQGHITNNGYPRFRRGHYGHSLGIDTFHEEPPYVSEGERTPIEEGMVLAIETPAYTTDAGAIMIEDLVHVLPNGIERLHKLPHELGVIS